MRFADGQNAQGNPVINSIPPTALFGSARTTGTGSQDIAILVNALPAKNINPEVVADMYFP
jgi:hypothetical protein